MQSKDSLVVQLCSESLLVLFFFNRGFILFFFLIFGLKSAHKSEFYFTRFSYVEGVHWNFLM